MLCSSQIVAEIEGEEGVEVVECGSVGEGEDGVAGQVEAGQPREGEDGRGDGGQGVAGEVEALQAALQAGQGVLGQGPALRE